MGMFDPKALATSIVDGENPEALDAGEGSEMSDTDLAAEDVLAAFAENDPKALSAALKAIFDSFEAKPHVEAESSEE
jgi:CRISPR/Cas system-associated protein Csm6